ncbi:hypothetical protein HZ326_9368 [Fusarium oxysporum f. sp. albedinis]|nr:hypothetical protein HZ326_9368 [Fusarium oxysporum f. sp. albedinis]
MRADFRPSRAFGGFKNEQFLRIAQGFVNVDVKFLQVFQPSLTVLSISILLIRNAIIFLGIDLLPYCQTLKLHITIYMMMSTWSEMSELTVHLQLGLAAGRPYAYSYCFSWRRGGLGQYA